jgi:hypothetical protein
VEGVFGSVVGLPILDIRKTGFYYNSLRNKCAKVKVVTAASLDLEQEKEPDISYVKPTGILECERLNIGESVAVDSILAEGELISVVCYCVHPKSITCTIRVKGTRRDVIANAWLNDILRDVIKQTSTNTPILELLVGPKKYHPIAKKSQLTFIATTGDVQK